MVMARAVLPAPATPFLFNLHQGADMISMDGFDCGGHPGHFLGLKSSAVGLAWTYVTLLYSLTSLTSLTSTSSILLCGPFMSHVPSSLIFVKSSAYFTIGQSLIEYVENWWLFGQLNLLAYI